MLQRGRTSAAPLPVMGQIAPKMQLDLVRWSCGALGLLPRLAQRRDLVLLADPSFVGEPHLYRAKLDPLLACDVRNGCRECFLKSSMAPRAWAWWRGRAESLRKPTSRSSRLKVCLATNGQKDGTRPSPRHDMEWCGRLGDLLAVPARELLPHRFDHLPLARSGLQRSRHVLAKFAQTVSTTAVTRCRRIDHHALARQMLWECMALGGFAREASHRGRFGDGIMSRAVV